MFPAGSLTTLRPPTVDALSEQQYPESPADYGTPRRQKSAPANTLSQKVIPSVRIQLFPHIEHHHGHHHHNHSHAEHFVFSPIEKDLKIGTLIKIGRKVDRKRERVAAAAVAEQLREVTSPTVAVTSPSTAKVVSPKRAGTERQKTLSDRQHAATSSTPNVTVNEEDERGFFGGMAGDANDSMLEDDSAAVSATSPISKRASMRAGGSSSRAGGNKEVSPEKRVEFIAFRSKVISRTHAEMWIGADGELYFRDVGSSSGSFLNRLRLSPSGKESRPYPLKSGDVIQLGVDYQGRQEEIYKSVMIKIFITVKGNRPRPNPVKLRSALRQLLGAMNGGQKDDYATTDCCILPLLGSALMFQCPLCRQVANLDASVTGEDQDTANEDEDGEDQKNHHATKQHMQPDEAPADESYLDQSDAALHQRLDLYMAGDQVHGLIHMSDDAAITGQEEYDDESDRDIPPINNQASPYQHATLARPQNPMLASDDDTDYPSHLSIGDVSLSHLRVDGGRTLTRPARAENASGLAVAENSSSNSTQNPAMRDEIFQSLTGSRPVSEIRDPRVSISGSLSRFGVSDSVAFTLGEAMSAENNNMSSSMTDADINVNNPQLDSLESYSQVLESLFSEFPTQFNTGRRDQLRSRLRRQREELEAFERALDGLSESTTVPTVSRGPSNNNNNSNNNNGSDTSQERESMRRRGKQGR
ncbi:hypothetical protein SmJEL517_g00885 [Synchytrium microbalum]|uniref:FHA domain-containing protein n=1 Tax=Synchytrium microbalum TaxID=1806994 RepID=A0A507CGA3_9FUNG|nr:uncharacterized protein SmJEL517_g00885 [Synchytrium microbalum]TPX36984.1 hypothetical protein SmJEL517_g00885 [Synchytrium microbalum]